MFLEIFLHKNNRHYNSYRCSYKFEIIALLSFLRNLKQESNFQLVGGLETKGISIFCIWLVVLYFRVIPNSIDFYKEFSYRLLHYFCLYYIAPWASRVFHTSYFNNGPSNTTEEICFPPVRAVYNTTCVLAPNTKN